MFYTFYCLPSSSLYKTTHWHWIHIKVCRVSCGGVFNMLLVLSITFYFITIYGVVCVQLAHFSIADWKNISIAHVIIIIKSEVSTFPIVIIFFRGCAWDVGCIIFCHLLPIRSGKTGNCVNYNCAGYDECKYSDTFWLADRTRLFVQYTISLSPLCKFISEGIELIKFLSDIFCRVCE